MGIIISGVSLKDNINFNLTAEPAGTQKANLDCEGEGDERRV